MWEMETIYWNYPSQIYPIYFLPFSYHEKRAVGDKFMFDEAAFPATIATVFTLVRKKIACNQ